MRKGREMAEKKNNTLLKTGIVGVVAGLLGGGVAYAGMSQVSQNSAQTAAPTVTTVKNTSKSSGQMTAAFNAVKNSVVSVVNLKRQSSTSSSSDPFGIFGDSDENSSSSSSSSKSNLETYSEGSGVIYMKSNGKGYIVTNNHVVSGSDEIQVILSDGKKVTAKKVGTDSETDLAVLTIDGKYVTQTAQFGNSKNVEPGQPVIAVGSPLGSQYATSVTQGIISAKSRTIDVTNSSGQVTNQATVIQTDAAINPGNSGGPLVNESGQVIGINSMKLSQSSDGTSVEGMGFAIPSDEVVTIINELVKNGKITRPQLGVRVASVSELTEYSKKQLNVPSSVKSGVYVASVTKNSSASKAGMKSGDIITKVDGKTVKDLASLHTVLYEHKIGDHVTVQVVRDGKTKNLSVTLSK